MGSCGSSYKRIIAEGGQEFPGDFFAIIFPRPRPRHRPATRGQKRHRPRSDALKGTSTGPERDQQPVKDYFRLFTAAIAMSSIFFMRFVMVLMIWDSS